MSSTDALGKRIEKLLARLEDQRRGPPHITCVWGNEELPDDGSTIIRTYWGSTTAEEDDEDEHRRA